MIKYEQSKELSGSTIYNVCKKKKKKSLNRFPLNVFIFYLMDCSVTLHLDET